MARLWQLCAPIAVIRGRRSKLRTNLPTGWYNRVWELAVVHLRCLLRQVLPRADDERLVDQLGIAIATWAVAEGQVQAKQRSMPPVSFQANLALHRMAVSGWNSACHVPQSCEWKAAAHNKSGRGGADKMPCDKRCVPYRKIMLGLGSSAASEVAYRWEKLLRHCKAGSCLSHLHNR